MVDQPDTMADVIARRRDWIDRSLSWRCKLVYLIGAAYWRALPNLIGIGSGRGPLLILFLVIAPFLVAATPIWFPYFKSPNPFDIDLAVKTTLALGAVMVLKAIADRASLTLAVSTKALKLRFNVAALEANLHKELSEIADLSTHVTGDRERRILQRILAATADEARAHLGYFDDTSFQATLLLFNDAACQHVRCVARAQENRPVGHSVPARDSIAFFWAERFPDRSSSVHDIQTVKIFPPRLSDGNKSSAYRSILILPLAERDAEGDSFRLRGVITLDSDRRYEFFGSRRRELESLLEPHVRWIMAITSDHPHIRTISGKA